MNPEAPSPSPEDPKTGPIDATWQNPLKEIRTYQGDIANAIKDQKESLVSMRMAEKARSDLLRTQSSTPEANPATKKRITSIVLFLCAILFLGAASVAGYYAYGTYQKKTAVPAVATRPNRFLPVATTSDIDTSSLSRDALISLLLGERGKSLSAGNIEQIELVKGVTDAAPLMTPAELMLTLGARPPGNLVRALDPLFMLGVLGQAAPAVSLPEATTTTATTTATTTPPEETTPVLQSAHQTVLLMKLDSYDNAYAGMLDWEKNMAEDILALFHSGDDPLGTSADATWTDVTLKNKDARALKNLDGKTMLIYSFYNQNLLIITGSEDALKTIITELDTGALAR